MLRASSGDCQYELNTCSMILACKLQNVWVIPTRRVETKREGLKQSASCNNTVRPCCLSSRVIISTRGTCGGRLYRFAGEHLKNQRRISWLSLLARRYLALIIRDLHRRWRPLRGMPRASECRGSPPATNATKKCGPLNKEGQREGGSRAARTKGWDRAREGGTG